MKQKTGRKLLSFLLSLVLVLGLMPGMSLIMPAYATEYLSGNVAVSNLSQGEIIGNGVTLSHTKPFNLYVNGNYAQGSYGYSYGSSWTTPTDQKFIFVKVQDHKDGDNTPRAWDYVYVTTLKVNVTGVQLNKQEITLPVGGNETLEAKVAPDNATDMTVTWTSRNEEVATVNNNGKVTAVAPGTAIITARATNGTDVETDDVTATCTVTVKKDPTVNDFTYTPPENLVYDGNTKSATVTPSQSIEGMGDVTVKYYSDGACTTETEPKNHGTYYVGITVAVGDKYNATTSVLHSKDWKFTIDKAEASAATVTANNRTYNGKEQPLVTIGEAEGGEMQYALGKDETTEPEASAYKASIPTATNAGTYYVWYKVVGYENHNDSEPACIPVTIKNAASGRSATPADALVYNGVEQALVKGGSVEGGTLMYAVTTDATQPALDAYSEAIPTASEAGTYYVWYYVKGDKNHNDTEPAMLTVVIAPQPAAAEPATPDEPSYLILAKLSTSGKKALKVSWTKVPGAEGFDIYFAHCGQTLQQVGTVGGSTTSYAVKGLNKYDAYKGYVTAWKTVNGAKVTIGESPLVHAVTGGYTNKYTNPKKVTVKKSKVKLAVGKSSKIKASVKKTKNSRKLLNHETKLRYYSSNPAVATVSASGKITAVGAGSCKIYAVAVNGARAAVKVTVK